jgi:hypothetical protein
LQHGRCTTLPSVATRRCTTLPSVATRRCTTLPSVATRRCTTLPSVAPCRNVIRHAGLVAQLLRQTCGPHRPTATAALRRIGRAAQRPPRSAAQRPLKAAAARMAHGGSLQRSAPRDGGRVDAGERRRAHGVCGLHSKRMR